MDVLKRLEATSRAEREARTVKNPTWRQSDPETGETVLRDGQVRLIEWLVDPVRDITMQQLADEVGVNVSTLHRWKKDRYVKAELEKKLAEVGASPDRAMEIVNAMFNAATKPTLGHPHGDVAAMKLYLEYTKRFMPTSRTIVEDVSVKNLSDEELADQLDEGVRQLRAV